MQINREDSVLIEELLKGDLKSFDLLFDKYAQKLYGFVLKFLRSEVDAEEVVQDVFIKVWENRLKLKKDSSFKSYLFTIAYNDVLNRLRSKSYHQAYIREAIALGDETSNSFESVEYKSVLEQVNVLIDKLPDRRRDIFVKSRIEGFSSKEIAERFGISVGTVDNNISEALKFLRKSLSNETMAVMLFFSLFI